MECLWRLIQRRIPNPAITIITALTGSGTLANVGNGNPLAAAKASRAVRPAKTAPYADS